MSSALGDNGTTHAWSKIRTRILKRDGYTCTYCGARANSVDHVIPRASWPEGQPGIDDPTNLVASCKPCNSRKGSKLNHREINKIKPKITRQW